MIEVIGIDHLYIASTDLPTSEAFYDQVLRDVMGFRKNTFSLGDDLHPEPHVQYFNRHFGFVLRPARTMAAHDSYAPGLHHFCFRVDSIADVQTIARELGARGIDASEARLCPDYAPDYWATYFTDPDGLRFEVTNYRAERRERHDHWNR